MARKTFKHAISKCSSDQLKRSMKKEETLSLSTDFNERLIKIETILKMMNNSFLHLSNQLTEIKHTVKYNCEK